VGKSVAAFVDATSVPAAIVGYFDGGGSVLVITQSFNAMKIARWLSISGFGLFWNMHVPPAPPAVPLLIEKAPLPPPCDVLGK
jgi:hypothetical protein